MRVGNFTSSEIVALTTKDRSGKGFGKPALTYIAECNMERRLGKSLETESNARPLVWGNLLEARAFDMLGLEYTLCSTDTIVHPEFNYWSGTPDGTKADGTVIDIKCPITLKSFCQLVDPLYGGLSGIDAINAVRESHKDGDKYYWQLVSNAILTNSKYAELVVYAPYESELEEIKSMAEGDKNCYWIWAAETEELPCLNSEGFYRNVNVIRFAVPQEDKDFLTEKVREAGEMLIKHPSILLASKDPVTGATIIEKAA